MAPRALGALFALVAAAAFAASIATSAWWSGPPIVDGHERSVQNVHVGLLGAEGCNPGGEGGCETIEVSDTARLTSYGVLGAHALATLFAFLLAISALRVGDGRKGLATASLVVTLLAAGGAGAMLALGPAIQAGGPVVEVPFGYGLYILGGAIVSSLLATILVRRIEREPLRLKPGVGSTMQPAQPDIREILRSDHEGVRPSAPNMFQAAPQLRPLYDAEGVPPSPSAPSVPTRAPTPLPRDQIDVLTGKATPPPLDQRPKRASVVPPPDAFASTLPAPAQMRAKPGTAPPRPKPPSAAPPGKVDLAGQTINAPPKQRAKTLQAGSDPGVKRPTSPPPTRTSQPAPRQSAPTLAHAVPPMPTADNLPPPAQLPPSERASTETDDSLETGMRPTENITAVEIDHEAKAKAQHARITGQRSAPSTKSPPIKSAPIKSIVPPPAKKPAAKRIETEDSRTGQHDATVGDITETGVEIESRPSANIITGEQRVLSTEQREVARAPTADPFDAREVTMPPQDPIHAPISETFPVARISELVPASAVPDEGPDNTSQTHAAPEPEDLMATMQRDKTPIPTLGARDRLPSETPVSGTHMPGSSRSMSTAPSSLPPPKNLTVDTVPSGPTPACPQCESPMAWVEEHLRFYCKSCRMYF